MLQTWKDIRLSSHQKSQKSPLPSLCLLDFPWNYWNTMEYPTIQAWPTTRVLEEGFNLESWWCDSTKKYLHHSMFDERAATIPSKSKRCLHRGSVIKLFEFHIYHIWIQEHAPDPFPFLHAQMLEMLDVAISDDKKWLKWERTIMEGDHEVLYQSKVIWRWHQLPLSCSRKTHSGT